MSYRLQRLIQKTVLRVFVFLAVTLGYIVLAHRHSLPALMEYYTGDFVRNNTRTFYAKYLGGSQGDEPMLIPKERRRWAIFWNVLDTLVREPHYLEARRSLEDLKNLLGNLPKTYAREIEKIGNSPPVSRFLRKPKGKFSDVYRYEILRLLDNRPFIKGLALLNQEGKVLLQTGTLDKDIVETAKNQKDHADLTFDSQKFRYKIRMEEGQGLLVGEWDFMRSPELLAMAGEFTGASILVLDSEFHLLSPRPTLPKKYFGNRDPIVYYGPLGGREVPYRFVRESFSGGVFVMVFPAAEFVFYLYRIVLFLLLTGTIVLVSFLMWKTLRTIRQEKLPLPVRWHEEKLNEAITLEEETLSLLRESQTWAMNREEQLRNSFVMVSHQMRQILKEHQKQIASERPKPMQAQPSTEESFDEFPTPAQMETEDSSPELPESAEIKEEATAATPVIPPPLKLDSDMGKVAVMDDFTGEIRIFPETEKPQDTERADTASGATPDDGLSVEKKPAEPDITQAKQASSTEPVSEAQDKAEPKAEEIALDDTQDSREGEESAVEKHTTEIKDTKDTSQPDASTSIGQMVYIEEDIYRNVLVILEHPPAELDLSLDNMRLPGLTEGQSFVSKTDEEENVRASNVGEAFHTESISDLIEALDSEKTESETSATLAEESLEEEFEELPDSEEETLESADELPPEPTAQRIEYEIRESSDRKNDEKSEVDSSHDKNDEWVEEDVITAEEVPEEWTVEREEIEIIAGSSA